MHSFLLRLAAAALPLLLALPCSPERIPGPSAKLGELLDSLDITTQVEGDIDPDDRIKLVTRVVDHSSGDTFYLQPVLENIDGKFSYSHRLTQRNGGGKYLLSGKAQAQAASENNLGLHVRAFETGQESANRALYARYAEYLRKYIDFVYSNDIDLDPSRLQALESRHVYFGSVSNGLAPAVEASFATERAGAEANLQRRFATLGGTSGAGESSLSYGVANFPGNGDAHSVQNVVASATGDQTVSGLKIEGAESPEGVESTGVGQSLALPGEGVSMTIVDAAGKVSAGGFTENASYSEDENGTLATVGETFNRSLHDFPSPAAKRPRGDLLRPFLRPRRRPQGECPFRAIQFNANYKRNPKKAKAQKVGSGDPNSGARLRGTCETGERKNNQQQSAGLTPRRASPPRPSRRQ